MPKSRKLGRASPQIGKRHPRSTKSVPRKKFTIPDVTEAIAEFESVIPSITRITEEDLLIPSGTDWSVEPYLVGTTEISEAWKGPVIFGLYLEVEEDPTPDGISLEVPLYNGHVDLGEPQGFSGIWNNSSEIAYPDVSVIEIIPDEPVELDVVIKTPGILSSDINVIQAIATFVLF